MSAPTAIHPSAVVDPGAMLGEGVRIGPFAYVGPEVEIGDGTVIGPHCTITGPTRIGSDNMLLAYTHVAHDCIVGNHCVFSNNSTLAGHVTIEDWVIMSGFAGVHQFCRVGAHAFIGMGVLLSGDVPPFTMVAGDAAGRPRGINSEGLKRRGFDADRIAAIKRAYRTLYVAGLPLAEAKQQLAEQAEASADVKALLHFIESGERPLQR